MCCIKMIECLISCYLKEPPVMTMLRVLMAVAPFTSWKYKQEARRMLSDILLTERIAAQNWEIGLVVRACFLVTSHDRFPSRSLAGYCVLLVCLLIRNLSLMDLSLSIACLCLSVVVIEIADFLLDLRLLFLGAFFALWADCLEGGIMMCENSVAIQAPHPVIIDSLSRSLLVFTSAYSWQASAGSSGR